MVYVREREPEVRMASRWVIVTALLLAPVAAAAQAAPSRDTIVIRITSPRGVEVPVTGSIVFRESRTERTFENVMTPVEVRVPRQEVDIRFAAVDGKSLSGELVHMRGGEQRGYARGTTHWGAITLYNDRSRYGFGQRWLGRILSMD